MCSKNSSSLVKFMPSIHPTSHTNFQWVDVKKKGKLEKQTKPKALQKIAWVEASNQNSNKNNKNRREELLHLVRVGCDTVCGPRNR